MSDVNNFITDLLDQMPERYATDVYINVDQVPVYGAGSTYGKNTYGRSDHNSKVDRDELVEDLAALGITKHAVEYFMAYTTSSGIKLVFKVFTVLSSGKVVSGRFVLIEDPSYALQDTLEKTSPILESVYYQNPEL